MTAQVAADLRAAAEVLRRDGFIKGKYHGKNGCHCVEGAIYLVTGVHEMVGRGQWLWRPAPKMGRTHQVMDALERELGRQYDVDFPVRISARRWNDKRARTAAEVIAALLAAADAAEEKSA